MGKLGMTILVESALQFFRGNASVRFGVSDCTIGIGIVPQL